MAPSMADLAVCLVPGAEPATASLNGSGLMMKTLVVAFALLGIMMRPPRPTSFGDDVAFLEKHTRVVLLGRGDAQVAVCPAYQGRVMTSTASGAAGPSLGWIHREHIASGKLVPHINVFGGEDRFWLGPEGGQFSIFFKQGDPFDLDHWQVPEPIDWGAWDAVSQSTSAVRFRKRMTLRNYSGTQMEDDVERTVRLLNPSDIAAHLGRSPGSAVRAVAFESSNTVTNAGSVQWQPASGLL